MITFLWPVVRRVKGPAPGLPLPERREVKLQMSGEELQVQLDMLETQQLGLERQGVLIEQMIRDKCEGKLIPALCHAFYTITNKNFLLRIFITVRIFLVKLLFITVPIRKAKNRPIVISPFVTRLSHEPIVRKLNFSRFLYFCS